LNKIKKSYLIFNMPLLIFYMVLSVSVNAATLEVGNGKTYARIQSAIADASPEDTVLVYDGIYAGSINLFGKAITVVSVNGPDVTKIDGYDQDSVVTFEGSGQVLDGFTIIGGVHCGYFSSPTINNCIISGNPDFGISIVLASASITKCTISGNTGIGITFGNTGGGCTISNCTISGNSEGGVSIALADPIITNCTISGNSKFGIRLAESSATISNCTISGNTGNGIYCSNYTSPTITNCSISGNTGCGIYSHYGSPRLNSCTISGNTGSGIYGEEAAFVTLKNSILWENSSKEIILMGSSSIAATYSNVPGGWEGIGNIDSNPQFVNAAGGDYHLAAGSPCIDSGTSDGAPATDMEGTPRPQGPGYDMGVNEYIVPDTTTAPTVITLAFFATIAGNNRIALRWRTESENQNTGFNLYRAESENGEFYKINTSLIPAYGSPTHGADYEFVDTNVQNRKMYYYKLEDIDLNGKSSYHGIVSSTPRWLYGFVE